MRRRVFSACANELWRHEAVDCSRLGTHVASPKSSRGNVRSRPSSTRSARVRKINGGSRPHQDADIAYQRHVESWQTGATRCSTAALQHCTLQHAATSAVWPCVRASRGGSYARSGCGRACLTCGAMRAWFYFRRESVIGHGIRLAPPRTTNSRSRKEAKKPLLMN